MSLLEVAICMWVNEKWNDPYQNKACLIYISHIYSMDWLISFLRPCQHDDGYVDGRSQIKVHIEVHSAQSSLVVTHPSTNRGRRYLTRVTKSPSKHWSPPRDLMKRNGNSNNNNNNSAVSICNKYTPYGIFA